MALVVRQDGVSLSYGYWGFENGIPHPQTTELVSQVLSIVESYPEYAEYSRLLVDLHRVLSDKYVLESCTLMDGGVFRVVKKSLDPDMYPSVAVAVDSLEMTLTSFEEVKLVSREIPKFDENRVAALSPALMRILTLVAENENRCFESVWHAAPEESLTLFRVYAPDSLLPVEVSCPKALVSASENKSHGHTWSEYCILYDVEASVAAGFTTFHSSSYLTTAGSTVDLVGNGLSGVDILTPAGNTVVSEYVPVDPGKEDSYER